MFPVWELPILNPDHCVYTPGSHTQGSCNLCLYCLCCALLLSSRTYSVLESCVVFFLLLPKSWDSRKTCMDFIERKKVSSLILRSCPSYPSQQCSVRILSRLVSLESISFTSEWRNLVCYAAFFAGTSCVLLDWVTCAACLSSHGKTLEGKEKAWLWLLTPVFIREAMSLSSTSVFSKCDVGAVYKTVLTCNAVLSLGVSQHLPIQGSQSSLLGSIMH